MEKIRQGEWEGCGGQSGYSCNSGGPDGCLKSYLSKDLEAMK